MARGCAPCWTGQYPDPHGEQFIRDVRPVLAVALLGAHGAWRYWLRASLKHRRYTADSAERQAAIDKEFQRWSEKLEARPKDAEMAAWQARDRKAFTRRW